MFKLIIIGWTLRWSSMWGSRGMKAERAHGGPETAQNQNTVQWIRPGLWSGLAPSFL